jgi:hypothetical protein
VHALPVKIVHDGEKIVHALPVKIVHQRQKNNAA